MRVVRSGSLGSEFGPASHGLHRAAHIAEAINNRGWTQIEAADRLGVDQPRISHLVSGHLSAFSIEALPGYLKPLDVKMNISIEDPVGDSNEKVVLAV